jgi:hypothetical protein
MQGWQASGGSTGAGEPTAWYRGQQKAERESNLLGQAGMDAMQPNLPSQHTLL